MLPASTSPVWTLHWRRTGCSSSSAAESIAASAALTAARLCISIFFGALKTASTSSPMNSSSVPPFCSRAWFTPSRTPSSRDNTSWGPLPLQISWKPLMSQKKMLTLEGMHPMLASTPAFITCFRRMTGTYLDHAIMADSKRLMDFLRPRSSCATGTGDHALHLHLRLSTCCMLVSLTIFLRELVAVMSSMSFIAFMSSIRSHKGCRQLWLDMCMMSAEKYSISSASIATTERVNLRLSKASYRDCLCPSKMAQSSQSESCICSK
mmetsp:Transcript_29160/g.67663  ORF Transcript_29160/g.67663 Transcript_29160/m.67663 type:complete len:265 (+) Transcript_29160:550-1344(+)